jgi:hypothetical protein
MIVHLPLEVIVPEDVTFRTLMSEVLIGVAVDGRTHVGVACYVWDARSGHVRRANGPGGDIAGGEIVLFATARVISRAAVCAFGYPAMFNIPLAIARVPVARQRGRRAFHADVEVNGQGLFSLFFLK